jgi:hypothetical protein
MSPILKLVGHKLGCLLKYAANLVPNLLALKKNKKFKDLYGIRLKGARIDLI